MKVKKLNLSGKLQYKQRQRWRKILSWLMGSSLFLLLLVTLLRLPWHWQLFLHWLRRGGDINHIPVHLHSEIRELCEQSGFNGIVNSYQSSLEIAYGLGRFHCQLSRTSDEWIISDRYEFYGTNSAAGTQLATLLIALVGSDYYYEIKATIPVEELSQE